MLRMRDLVEVFERAAARRANHAHQAQVTVGLAPLRHVWLTEVDCQQIDGARLRYLREHRRHNLWLKRRFENAGLEHQPYAPA